MQTEASTTPRISTAPPASPQPRPRNPGRPRAHAAPPAITSARARPARTPLETGDAAREPGLAKGVGAPRVVPGESSRPTAAQARASDPLRGLGPILRRGDGRPAVALTGPVVDGGTRVELATAGLAGRMGELVGRLQAHGRVGELVELPLANGLTAWASLLSTRAKGGGVALLVADVVHVTIGARFTRLEFKAGGLWRDGWAATAGRWISSASAWSGRADVTLATSHAAGWRVTGLELCRDLQGLGGWTMDDASLAAWTGWRGATITTHSQASGSTVSVGSRKGSNVSLCCYGKTAQILACVGAGAAAMYAAIWARSPAYQASRDVQRVEFRLRKRGLDLACSRTGEVGMLRDPAALADLDTLGRVWAYLAARYRLVVPSERGTHKAIPSDPRWLVVASVPESTEGAARDFAQARDASRATLAEQQQRARQRLIDAIARDAGLHGARPSSSNAAIEWTRFRLTDSHPAELAKMAARAESVTRTRSTADGWALDCSADESRLAIGTVVGLGWTAGAAHHADVARPARPMFGVGPWIDRPPVHSPKNGAALVSMIGGAL